MLLFYELFFRATECLAHYQCLVWLESFFWQCSSRSNSKAWWLCCLTTGPRRLPTHQLTFASSTYIDTKLCFIWSLYFHWFIFLFHNSHQTISTDLLIICYKINWILILWIFLCPMDFVILSLGDESYGSLEFFYYTSLRFGWFYTLNHPSGVHKPSNYWRLDKHMDRCSNCCRDLITVWSYPSIMLLLSCTNCGQVMARKSVDITSVRRN